MNYVLDIIILIIIGIAMMMGAKKGFVKTVSGMICFLLAIILSFTLSSKLADIIYTGFMEEKVVATISENLDDAGFGVISDATGDLVETVKKAIEESTVFGISSSNVGASDESITQNIADSSAQTSAELAKELSAELVKPIVIRIMESILFLVLFVLFTLLIKPVTSLVNKMFSFSIVGTLNKMLGGISGIFVGVLISIAFVTLVNNYVSISTYEFLEITPQTLKDTYLFSFLLNLV